MPDEEARILTLGADAYMTKPFERDLLLAHIARGERHVSERRAATKEPVTGFQSREVVEATIKHQVGISKRYKRPLSLLILDINQIEMIRSTKGNEVGDAVIYQVAEIIEEQCRTTDIPARWFKDELVIVLPETSVDLALDVAERIRVRIQGVHVAGTDLTASLGVSDMLKLPVNKFIAHYRHLYESKKNINKASIVGKR